IYDLGQFFYFITENEVSKKENLAKYEYLQDEFKAKLKLAEIQNPWFTQDNLKFCLEQWGKILTEENLKNWIKNHSEPENPKNIGIIMAGNVPRVGVHGLLSVLVSRNSAIVETSSQDDVLMNFVLNYLKEFESLEKCIQEVHKLPQHE